MKNQYSWDDQTVSVIPGDNRGSNVTYLISLFDIAIGFVLDKLLECFIIFFKCFAGTAGIIFAMCVTARMLGYF